LKVARKSLENQNYINKAIIAIIRKYSPQYTIDSKFYYFVERHKNGFDIITNLEIEKLNKLGVKSGDIHPDSIIDNARIVDHLLRVEIELFVSSFMNSEITTDLLHSDIIGLKCNDILHKLNNDQDQLELFQNIVFEDGKAIRECINTNPCLFDSILPLLEESEKYHKWTKSIGNDRKLIQEYYQEIASNSWIDKLPPKAVRFSLFTGAGVLIEAACPTGLGTALGIALSAGDTFLLDKIIKGWKPNLYIERIQAIKTAS
jgi:hypothetical protein